MRELSERLLAWYNDDEEATRSLQIVICPPFTALSTVQPHVSGIGAFLGAQNVHWEDAGAFTGEISAPMLLDIGCSHVIIGHSERRSIARESDEEIANRLAAALRHGLQPILCVGEDEQQRQNGEAEQVVRRQLDIVLQQVRKELLGRELVIAYEPVWAIGSGEAATPADAREMAGVIHAKWNETMSGQANCRVLYGGSVSAENLKGFLTEGRMDGALVGGNSLRAATFFDIIQCAASAG